MLGNQLYLDLDNSENPIGDLGTILYQYLSESGHHTYPEAPVPQILVASGVATYTVGTAQIRNYLHSNRGESGARTPDGPGSMRVP